MPPTSSLLPMDIRNQSLAIINAGLADTIDLRSQLRHAFWNARGGDAQDARQLFDVLSAVAETWSDLLAERAIALDGVAWGTLGTVCRSTSLKPYDVDVAPADRHLHAVAAVIADFGHKIDAACAALLAHGDGANAQSFEEIARGVDALCWLVTCRLQPDTGYLIAKTLPGSDAGTPGVGTGLSAHGFRDD